MNEQEIRTLIARQPEGHSLDRAFYTDPDIYRREIDRIYLRSWLYAGHVSEIPKLGDWFLFEFADESVIIVRSDEQTVTALLNVCRHRGSRLRTDHSGCSRRFSCPYHGWTYALDGRLLVAAYMAEDFDKSKFGLRTIACEILDGMIYVNFADNPGPFRIVSDGLAASLAPYGLADARVAHRQAYPIAANWKLSVENYQECYHCAPSHPEYSRGHSLAKPGARTAPLMDEANARRPACGLTTGNLGRTYRNAEAFGADYAYDAYPLWNGHVTGSEDGQPVAPLLGSIRDYDGSCTDLQVGPVTFALMYCDHVVIYFFYPTGPDSSVCDISWLVRGDAVEGVDYDKSKLTWLWDVTTHADKRIIETNARGVRSKRYQPGPLSTMEAYLWSFLEWYLDTMDGEDNKPVVRPVSHTG
ncbi:MAG: aromatic ring-hydroxylating dioxygenase subunit alpha [Xanthomonadales bacterium]|nr:aromatic ring-hydroxylating dioxygenase subunit alpha [Xanthomonadales bacterium]